MSEAAPTARPARALALVAGLAASAPFVDSLRLPPWEAGLSTFGRPPAFKMLLALAAVLIVVAALRATSRLALARLLALVLLAGTLFGQRAVPCSPGAPLVLLGAALAVAAPWLAATPAALVSAAALLLALPALIGSVNPQGAVDWTVAVLPHASLPLLLPSLFPGRLARRPALAVVLVSGLLCAASLLDYVALSRGLGLPLGSLAATRLRPLGLHPNLAVPQLVMSLSLGFALCWSLSGGRRRAALVATLAVAGALLAVGSRTGTLAAVLAVGVLVFARARLPGPPRVMERLRALVRPLVLAGVAGALLLPVSGVTDPTITDLDSRMVSKAVSFRSAMWELGRDAWHAAPWDGWGPGTTFMQGAVARPSRYDGLPKDDHPHNVLLATGAALGWPGLAGLLLLGVAGLRRRFGGPLVADGAAAGLMAMWIANGIDMGGAATTLYPALAFLGLALGDAACRATSADPLPATPPTGRAASLAWAGLAVLLAVGGLLRTGQEHALVKASRLLGQAADAQADAPADTDTADNNGADTDALRERALASLARVEPFAPFDARIPQLRARAAGLAPADPAAVRAALEAALLLQPRSARLHHRLAQVRLRDDVDDAGAGTLLEQALALDPWGPEAWRAHLDRATVAATRGDREQAFASFIDALLLDPAAVSQAGWSAATRSLRLSADPTGRRGASFPLDKLLAEIGRRRAERAEVDPPYAARLSMREVDILQQLDLADEADAAARELLADGNQAVFAHHLVISAARREAWAEVVALLHETGLHGHSWTETDLLDALSRLDEPDVEDFEATWALLERDLGDVLFEPDVLRRALAARKRLAERTLDAEAAALWAERLAYAER